jgi:DNA-binding CsgD family transcriptional regulator
MRPYFEPVVGVILLGVWWLLVAPRIVGYVPMRDDTFATNPYAVLVAIGFALAIAISRVRPGAALTLAGGLVALQLLFWPMRFGQSSWIAYLLLIGLAAGVGAYSRGAGRKVKFALSLLLAVVVSALLTLPSLSLSGVEGTINGKPWQSPEVIQGFLVWTAVGVLLTVAAWNVGSRNRHLGIRGAVLSSDGIQDRGSAAVDGQDGFHASRSGSALFGSLSPREREIFVLVARGLSNSEVAAAASIGESTVKTHLSSILTKLGLTSRSQIVVYAYENGIASPHRV